MSNKALADLLGRMAKDDALLKEFCANPGKVLGREGIKVPANEIPASIDAKEFSKRLKGSLAAGSGTVDLTPFAAEGDAQATKTGVIIYVDTPIGGTKIETVPADPAPGGGGDGTGGLPKPK